MVKLFRNIRPKLLQSGKLKSYSAYAFGEIFLVVVGILIALQINNWNTDRIAILNYKKQLDKVAENIMSDAKQLLQLKEDRQKFINFSTRTIDQLKIGYIKDPVAFLDSFMYLTGEKKFVSDQSNYLGGDDSYQSDNIKNQSIHDMIDDYIKITENIKFREFRHNQFSENMEEDLWKDGFFNQVWQQVRILKGNTYHVKKDGPFELDKSVYNNNALISIFLRTEFGFSVLLREYDELIAKGEELIAAIEYFTKE